ncbi:hypothetical protein BJV82DRAFT_718586 [Fennellomyces sp. T-0311]|nr:hypothetical protein BJV82DRAFT_718586 [Fennellomyces sp. T-0311]
MTPTPFNAKCMAIHEVSYTEHALESQIKVLDRKINPLSRRGYAKTVAEVKRSIQDANKVEQVVQYLDFQLRRYIEEERYREALEEAENMQAQAPSMHYGYSRQIQIHLILDNYREALSALHAGFNALVRQNDIDELYRSVELLDQTAADLAILNKFDDASEIADMLITLAPRSHIGYLRAGTVFLLQGKVDGAVAMYDRGIATPSIDNQYLLVERKNLVLRQLRSNDYITRAPYDIVERISCYLDTHDLFRCLDVCYDWKMVFQEQSKAWRSVVICSHTNMYSIQQAKSHIRTIQIPAAAKCMVVICLKLIAAGEFPNLVELELDSNNPTFTPSCFESHMSRHGSNNTELTIPKHHRSLKHFVHRNIEAKEGDQSLPVCEHFYKLMTCTRNEVQKITRACPCLTSIMFDKTEIASTGSQPYPIYKITRTIRSAYEPGADIWKDLPKITTLTVKRMTLSYSKNINNKQWIGDCPALEEFKLKNMKIKDGSILYAIKRLPKLRLLEFQSCKFTGSFTRFESFFYLLAFKGDKVQLETLVIDDLTVADRANYICAIAQFRRLRNLTIIKGNCTTGIAIEQFAVKLKEVDSLLEELTITGVADVVDDTLFSIVDNIPRLRRLTLNDLDEITDYGIRMIVTGREEVKLSTLNIQRCSKVTKKGMHYATRLGSHGDESRPF